MTDLLINSIDDNILENIKKSLSKMNDKTIDEVIIICNNIKISNNKENSKKK
jgi:uncharacterized alkaline shock family protein YloU